MLLLNITMNHIEQTLVFLSSYESFVYEIVKQDTNSAISCLVLALSCVVQKPIKTRWPVVVLHDAFRQYFVLILFKVLILVILSTEFW